MADAVKILVSGLPATLVREIGLRLKGSAVSDFDNTQRMGRAASQGDAALVILSDALPINEAAVVASRARDANDKVRIAYCLSMAQAEALIETIASTRADRIFLMPVAVDEMLRELSKLSGLPVLPPAAAHEQSLAAAIFEAWDRARSPTLQKVDKLDDAAIALLDNALTPELKSAAHLESLAIADLASRFGFSNAATVAREIADRMTSPSLSQVDGVGISEQLLLLRQHLSGVPQQPPPDHPASDRATPPRPAPAIDEAARESFRVLAIDDEPAITRGLTSLLSRRKIPVTAINDPLKFWSAIDETKPNLVLMDLEMPKLSGTELCRAMRNDRRWSEIPVIFLTGHTDAESVQRIFSAGADDYVGKPFVPAELVMRIETRLSGVKVRRVPVETDPVTGLPTGAKATDLIQRFLRLARRKADPYSLAIIEIDDLPNVIKSHGRRIGDIVLRATGEMLQKSFRGEDVVGWWGGPEFIIGMYGSSKAQSAIKLTQIASKVGDLSFSAESGAPVRVQSTAGVAQYQVDGEDVAALRNAALAALAEVRKVGHGRVGISGVQPTGPMTRRVDVAIVDDDTALVSLLQHAMESRSLSVAAFSDGETAADALTGNVPEVQAAVILLNVDLPGLNGLEVLRRLKAVQVTRVSRVVMLTARTNERDILAALELGAIDHIAKPFSVPVLVHKVRAALRQDQPW